MKLIINNENGKLYHGFAQDILQVIEPESVDCIVTSPPYYGLRNYGEETIQIFDDKDCKHKWENYRGKWDKKNALHKSSPNLICAKCNAIKTQLGLEPTVDLYISHLAYIFEIVLKTLKPDGTCFINIGDTYLDNGNLALVPERLAIALIEKGFYLRNKLIWNKRIAYKTEDGWTTQGNGLPESAENRFSKSTEIILFFTKKKSGYFFDVNALKLNWKEESILRLMRGVSEEHKYAKLPLYGGGGGLNKPRLNVKKYNGKMKSIAEQVSSIRAREMRNIDDSLCNYGSFYRNYGKDINSEEMQFVLWLKQEIESKGIEAKLSGLFGPYLWRSWIRLDRPMILIPSIEQWNVVKKLLGIAETPFDYLIKKHGYKRPPDSFLINTQPRPESHFATMPDMLIQILILHGSKEGDIILDPFGGICTTATVASRLGRRWICIEPVYEFIEIARQRIEFENIQQKLPLGG